MKTALELCNRIAAIEGLNIRDGDWGQEMPNRLVSIITNDIEHEHYHCGKGLLFDLMVKYEVFIDYHVSEVIIVDYGKQKSYEVDFDTTDDIPRSILECIKESKR